MYDDQQNYFTNLVTILKNVDGNKFTADKKNDLWQKKTPATNMGLALLTKDV